MNSLSVSINKTSFYLRIKNDFYSVSDYSLVYKNI